MADAKSKQAQPQSKQTTPVPQQGHGLAVYGLIALVFIIAGIAVFYLQGQQIPKQTQYVQPNQALYNILSSRTFSPTATSAFIAQQLNTTPQLNIQYNGTASVGLHASLFTIPITVPFWINYSKYNANSRVDASTKISFLTYYYSGALSYYHLNNIYYLCSPATSNSSAACSSSNTSELNFTTLFNFSNSTSNASKGFGTNFKLVKEISTEYGNQPCILSVYSMNAQLQSVTSGALNVAPISNYTQFGPLTGNMSACFSDQYGLPLNVTINGMATNQSSGNSVQLIVKVAATKITQSSSNAYVTTLLGHVS